MSDKIPGDFFSGEVYTIKVETRFKRVWWNPYTWLTQVATYKNVTPGQAMTIIAKINSLNHSQADGERGLDVHKD